MIAADIDNGRHCHGSEPELRALRWLLLAGLILATSAVWSPRAASQPSADRDASPADARLPRHERLDHFWKILAGDDDAAANDAVQALMGSPVEALAWIDERLSPVLDAAPDQVATLIGQLDAAQFSTRQQAAQQLRTLRWGIEPQLRTALAAAPALEARLRLETILADGQPVVAVEGAILMTRTEHDRRLVRLAQVLREIDSPRAAEILQIMGTAAEMKVVDPRLPPLYAGLYSQDRVKRASSAVQVAALGDAGLLVLDRLIELLADVDGPLVKIPEDQYQRLVADLVLEALPRFGASAIDPLLTALADHENAEVRLRAATALGRIGDDRAIEPLLSALSDNDREVTTAALSALQYIGPAAVEPMISVLQGRNPLPDRPLEGNMRLAIASGLSQMGDARAVEPIAELLFDEDPTRRQWAAENLRKLRDLAADAMIRALSSDHPHLRDDGQTRTSLVHNLSQTAPTNALRELMFAMAEDGDEQVRAAALSWFAQQASADSFVPRAWNLLIAKLADPSPRVRQSAANVIGNVSNYQLPDDRAAIDAPLLKLLDDESIDVKQNAIEALGSWKVTAAVEPLLALLTNNELNGSAASALGQIGDPRAAAPLRKFLAEGVENSTELYARSRTIRALGALFDQESVELLIPYLQSNEEQTRRAAAEALGEIGDLRAVEPLIAVLDKDEQTMRAAASALGELGDPRAIEPLIQSIDSTARAFRFGNAGRDDPGSNPAGYPLRLMGQAAVEPLAYALSDPNRRVREVAARALYGLTVPGEIYEADLNAARESLAAALYDESPIVCYHAASTLGRLQDKRALPFLIKLIGQDLDDYSSFTRYNLPSYISRIGDPAAVEPISKWLADERPAVRGAAARALGYLHDPKGLPALLKVTDDSDPRVRKETAGALGRLKTAEALEPLFKLLQDEDPEVRAEAANGLGYLGEATAGDALVAAAAAAVKLEVQGEGAKPLAYYGNLDARFLVRVAAGVALLRLEDKRGVAVLTACLTDGDAKRREFAATEIAIFLPSAVAILEPLITAASDPSVRVRLYVALALGKIANEQAIDVLLQMTADKANLPNVMDGLGRTKSPRAVPALITHLEDESPHVRRAAAAALASFKDAEHIPLLAPLLHDPTRDVRLATVSALRAIGSPEAIEPLRSALEDDHPQVRLAAESTIQKLTNPETLQNTP